MRYVAPARDAVDPLVFRRMPLTAWREYAGLTEGRDWPAIDALNAIRPAGMRERFVVQARELLADGMHYEQRIADRGLIATRERNWHDLFNALVWLRHAPLKRALNTQQVGEIAHAGPRRRTRPQCALTHFDEAGVILALRDPGLLALWDAHDWHGLFWRHREAWRDGSLELVVFGHALLEHALSPNRLLVGKAVAVVDSTGAACARVADAVADGHLLRDPQELRPLPLSGIPGWHEENANEAFHREAACYRPLRPGRTYPPPLGA